MAGLLLIGATAFLAADAQGSFIGALVFAADAAFTLWFVGGTTDREQRAKDDASL